MEQRGGRGLACRLVGEGAPVLLVHGWGVSRSVWQPLEAELAGHVRLVQVELPGLGASPPAAGDFGPAAIAGIRSLREQLGIERWTVLGYSAGAGITSRYVRGDAAAVDGAVFLCPLLPLGIYRAFIPAQRLTRRTWTGPESWLTSGWRLHWLMRLFAFNTPRRAPARAWHREWASQPRQVLWDQFGDMFDLDWDALPPTVPQLRIWGRRDRLAARPRRARDCDRVIDAAHSAPLDNAPAVAAELLAFLEGLPVRQAPARQAPAL